MTHALPASFSPPADLLAGRRILITGAGEGLGKAAAMACAQHGATVILLGRTVKKLEHTYDAIERAGGVQPAIYPMNLAGAAWKDHVDLADTLEREFGTLEGLLHCAVHFKSFSPMLQIEPKDWIENLQTNLTAAYALTRELMPLMRAATDASVVFTADRPSHDARAYDGVYGVAKAAVEQMMQIWAAEQDEHSTVRLNSFNPGPIRSGVRLRGFPGERAESIALPEQVMPQLLWLLSNQSRGLNGQSTVMPE